MRETLAWLHRGQRELRTTAWGKSLVNFSSYTMYLPVFMKAGRSLIIFLLISQWSWAVPIKRQFICWWCRSLWQRRTRRTWCRSRGNYFSTCPSIVWWTCMIHEIFWLMSIFSLSYFFHFYWFVFSGTWEVIRKNQVWHVEKSLEPLKNIKES